MKFSANLGLLWKELPLPDAIYAAKKAGFDAVECHWPYSYDPADISAALEQTGLTMTSLNSYPGNVGEMGLLALEEREEEARESVRQAIDYAVSINVSKVHMMAGFASGIQAHECFIKNLRYACSLAKPRDITILIEPLNNKDAAGYFLQTAEQAIEILDEVDEDNIQLLFDVYHMQHMGGDISKRIEKYLPVIGHIQIASVPDRGAPDHGEINYDYVLSYLQKLGWDQSIGAEYKPMGKTEDSLSWLAVHSRK